MRFPLFIDISGKMVVIVGGGKVSARRTDTLLKFGAKIKVISPHFFAGEMIKMLCISEKNLSRRI